MTERILAENKKCETEHIVAIMDLLGASEMIASEKSEFGLNIVSKVFEKASYDWPRLGNAPSVLYNIKCVTFSDNIALALDLSALPDKKAAIESFIKYISVFQGAALKSELLFRGGITVGPLYMDMKTNFVWGKALFDAHILEEKVAIYPRVVLSRWFEEFNPLSFSKVRQDLDGICFVDYVSTVNRLYPSWIEKCKALIKKQYSEREGKTGQERVLQKYGWLQCYIEQCEKTNISSNNQQ